MGLPGVEKKLLIGVIGQQEKNGSHGWVGDEIFKQNETISPSVMIISFLAS